MDITLNTKDSNSDLFLIDESLQGEDLLALGDELLLDYPLQLALVQEQLQNFTLDSDFTVPIKLGVGEEADTESQKASAVQNFSSQNVSNEKAIANVLVHELEEKIDVPINSIEQANLVATTTNEDNSLLAYNSISSTEVSRNNLPTAVGTEVYILDDGTSENSIGITVGGDIMWLNQFTAVSGSETISSIALAWGTPVYPGEIPSGKPTTVALYEDPDDDGNPDDAVLLATASTSVTNPDTDLFTTVSITPSTVSGSFFVGVLLPNQQAGEYPASLDQSAPVSGRSWIVSSTTPGTFNLNDLSDPNHDLPLGLIESYGLPGNWLLRADAGSQNGSIFTNSTPINIPSSGAGSLYPSTINVSGLSDPITQVTVTLYGMNHTWPDDIDILLVGPEGQKSLLMSDVGSSSDVNGLNLTFDQNAGVSLPDSSQLTSGTYLPTNVGTGDTFNSPAPGGPYDADLSPFTGTNANGTWSLYVMDDTGYDSGSIAGGWSLNFQTGQPQLGSISGMKWNDLNGDGVKDAEEPGLANWEIYIDIDQNGQLDQGEPVEVTDAQGNYTFSDLSAGTYVIAEVQEEGWEQTYPSSGGDFISEFQIATDPSFLLDYGSYLTEVSQESPLDITRNFLQENFKELGLTEGDWENFVVTNQYVTEHNGANHIYLNQQLNGLKVFNGDMNLTVTKEGQVLSIGSSFGKNLNQQYNTAYPQLSAEESLEVAANHIGLTLDQPLSVVEQIGGVAQEVIFSGANISRDDIPAKLMYYIDRDNSVKLAWHTVINTTDSADWWEMLIDAVSGDVLEQINWTSHASYNVFPSPLEHPDDGSRGLVIDAHNLTASPFGWHDTNGLAGAEFLDTRGNNVFAQEDMDDNNTGGSRPSGGAGLIFDFPLDLNQDPINYQDASITNLFYWNNILHDVHYHYGFDEVAGNFQENNYGNGGTGGDPVQADSLDGSGVNNANFATPPDGFDPRMQMFRFNLTSPNRDSALSNVIIIHEYGHGVSNRLTGGPANSGALYATQSRAMGEGWSDFWSLALTMKSTDAYNGTYPVGTYVLGEDPVTGSGIRNFPYSTDMTVNPHVFEDIKTLNHPHGAGEVWAVTLLDLFWNFVDQYGFDPDLYNGTGGNNIVLQLVMDGLKIQPSNPTYLEARDAILQADQLNNGGVNEQIIWETFARRGMGIDADDGGDPNSLNVTNGFDVPIVLEDVHVVDLGAGQDITDIDFGNRELLPGSISGMKWNDLNGDGVKDAGEAGLADWEIYIDINQNGQLDTGEPVEVTDAQGNYTFSDLSAGNYVIAEVQQEGWEQTYPVPSDGFSSLPLEEILNGITTTSSQVPIYTQGEVVPLTNGDSIIPQTNVSAPLINIDEFRADPRFAGIDGSGFATVILDTGIDLDHPFFGPDNDSNSIADRIVYQYDFANGDGDASDVNGHGSNVSSIVASSDGTYTGMAPGADIIHLKVFTNAGSGNFSYIEQALQWVVSNAANYNIASVNMSLSDGQNHNTAQTLYGISDELDALDAMNIIVASASGNSFYNYGSAQGVGYPSADPNSLSVGAVFDDDVGSIFWGSGAIDWSTDADRIASFSQRHSTLSDIFAPGPFSTGAGADGGLETQGGTSQASPHIAGIAVLAQELAMQRLGRRLTLSEFSDLLDSTGVTINDGDDEDDNVTNTGLDLKRVDMLALGKAIWSMGGGLPGTHTVDLEAGEDETDIDFGNRQEFPEQFQPDFNLDGKRDFVWRNEATGQNVVWYMDGATRIGHDYLSQVSNTDWQIVGAGDPNGDQNTDIYWRNEATGANVVWYMDGATRIGYDQLSKVGNTDWQIVGIGDPDGDSLVDDIYWRNQATGQNVIWYMDGATRIGYDYISQVSNTDWQIASIGDVDGDSLVDDLVWRNQVTGRNVEWFMECETCSDTAALPQVTNMDWQIVGTGDATGDQKTDIFWRNQVTGRNVCWAMDGTNITSVDEFPQVSNPDWQIVI